MAAKTIREERALKAWKLYTSGLNMQEIAKALNNHYETTWKDIHYMMRKIGHEQLSLKGMEYLTKWISQQDSRIRRLITHLNKPDINLKEELSIIDRLQKEHEIALKTGASLGLLTGENIQVIGTQNIQRNELSIYQIIEAAEKAEKHDDRPRITNPVVEEQGSEKAL